MNEIDLKELDLLLEQLCEGLLEKEPHACDRLVQLLRESKACRRRYLETIELHTALSMARGCKASLSEFSFEMGQTTSRCSLDQPQCESHPFVKFPSTPLFSLTYLSSGWPVAYLIAAVIFGIGAIIGAVTHVSHQSKQIALESRSITNDKTAPAPRLPRIGRITKLADCEWADPKTAPVDRVVHLNQTYALISGLLEIAYDSGAKVILQGPVAYRVSADNSGYLSSGKLTARVEKDSISKGLSEGFRVQGSENSKGKMGEGRGESKNNLKSEIRNLNSQIQNPKSQIEKSLAPSPSPLVPSLSPVPCPLFFVQTPTATVTDLGTEFGVEVARDGATDAHVFRGAVRIEAATDEGRGNGQAQTLAAGQHAAVGANRMLMVGGAGTGERAKRFIREMPDEPDSTEAYAKLVLSMNPVVYYRMEQWPKADKPGCYVLVDSAPGGHHGLVCMDESFGKPACRGRFGGGLDIHGEAAREYAVVKNYPKADKGRISVSAWVWAVTDSPWAMVVGNWYVPTDRKTPSRGQFCLGLAQNLELSAGIFQQNSRSAVVAESGNQFPRNQWHHIALVADGELLHLYRDGREIGSTPHRGIARPQFPECLSIGAHLDSDGTVHDGPNAYMWNGRLDEIAVFNHAIRPEQVRQLYTGQSSK